MACIQCNNSDKRTKTNRKLCNRGHNLKRLYDITFDEYGALLKKQDYKCAICRTADMKTERTSWFVVDHCHTTGKVRGLLCNSCNRGIGLLKESVENFSNAIEYLNEHRNNL